MEIFRIITSNLNLISLPHGLLTPPIFKADDCNIPSDADYMTIYGYLIDWVHEVMKVFQNLCNVLSDIWTKQITR